MDLLTVGLVGAARVAGALGRASLQGGLLILAVFLLCRLAPRLPAALRTWLWWIACLRLLVGLSGLEPVRLPLLPAVPTAATPASITTPARSGVRLPSRTADWLREPPKGGRPQMQPDPGPGALALLGGLWLLAVAVQLGLAVRQLLKTRRTLRTSEAVTGGGVDALWDELRRRVGVSGVPLLAAAEVLTPQAAGLWRPRVLLPRKQLDRLSAPELSMVLCHELVHLRRGDLWLGWVPALAERLFFFHPLAALAAREYSLAREAACDAEVLAVLDEAPQAYGRLLLKLGIGPRATVLAAATAAPSRHHLKRRLQMLEHAKERRSSVAWSVLLGLLALLGLVPFRIVAAQEAARPARVAAPSQRQSQPPQPPQAPQPPRPPRAPKPPHPRSSSHHWKNVGGEEYVLLSANGSSTMSGSSSDIARARKLLGPGEKEILWFRHGGKEYVVRDPQTLKTARDLFAPQAELGARQAELGAKQAELGSRQAALGAEQGKLGAQQGKLGAEQARLAADQVRHDRDGKGADDLEAKENDLGKQQDELGRQQDELGKKQDELGRQQDELGKQQDELGQQQDKLGREAEEKFRVLMNDAVARGLAREVGA